jgi:hypothetical protein
MALFKGFGLLSGEMKIGSADLAELDADASHHEM